MWAARSASYGQHSVWARGRCGLPTRRHSIPVWAQFWQPAAPELRLHSVLVAVANRDAQTECGLAAFKRPELGQTD